MLVATVLTACGIETGKFNADIFTKFVRVATVLTACGIETGNLFLVRFQYRKRKLQQCLPLAVLKH